MVWRGGEGGTLDVAAGTPKCCDDTAQVGHLVIARDRGPGWVWRGAGIYYAHVHAHKLHKSLH